MHSNYSSAGHAPCLTAASFGDYIVYVDESGDHGLERMDPAYPIFVLAFCVFEKASLARIAVPAMMRFKFAHFGHDQVVLHEHDIRKSKGVFRFLSDSTRRHEFMCDLTALLDVAPFTIIAVVIRKDQLVARYKVPANPYMLAMEFGLERVCSFLGEKKQHGRLTHCVFECRGAKEDAELELEFRRVAGGANAICSRVPVDILMADKKTVSTGLQLADLVARPIGQLILRSDQANRTRDVLMPKFRRGTGDRIDGYGLKVFP